MSARSTQSGESPAAPAPGDAETRGHDAGHHGAAHIQLAMLSLLACGLLAAGATAGQKGLNASVFALQCALVGSWVFGSRLPGRIGGTVIGFAAAFGADAAVIKYHDDGYGPLLGVLGVAVPLMFVHQLTRGVVRNRVMESLSDITLMLVAVTAASGLIILRYQSNGAKVVTALALALGAALAVNHVIDLMFPVARFDEAVDRGLPGVVLGVLGGGVVGLLMLRGLIDFLGGRGALVGASVAAVGCLLSIGASFAGLHSSLAWVPGETPAESAWRLRLRSVAAVLITVCLSSPAGYVLVGALST